MEEARPMADRRDFLRHLVTLPLIGGGVTLIEAPATPLTADTGCSRTSVRQPCRSRPIRLEGFFLCDA